MCPVDSKDSLCTFAGRKGLPVMQTPLVVRVSQPLSEDSLDAKDLGRHLRESPIPPEWEELHSLYS